MLIAIPDEIAHRVSFSFHEDDAPAIKNANASASVTKSLAAELDSPDPAVRETAIRAIAEARTASEYGLPAGAVPELRKSASPSRPASHSTSHGSPARSLRTCSSTTTRRCESPRSGSSTALKAKKIAAHMASETAVAAVSRLPAYKAATLSDGDCFFLTATIAEQLHRSGLFLEYVRLQRRVKNLEKSGSPSLYRDRFSRSRGLIPLTPADFRVALAPQVPPRPAPGGVYSLRPEEAS